MVENAIDAGGPTTSTGTFYDKIARFYDLTFKVNGYGRSLEKYLRATDLRLPRKSRILDAGCGTGLLTLSLLKVVGGNSTITAVDLSASSLQKARKAVAELGQHRHRVTFTQANVLALPFRDNVFDLIVTSGVLEYVSLQAGFSELSRVLKPGGFLIHLPVRPSPVSWLLEVLFRFKAHTPHSVAENTRRYFRVVDHHRFPAHHPIGWTKTAVLAQKL